MSSYPWQWNCSTETWIWWTFEIEVALEVCLPRISLFNLVTDCYLISLVKGFILWLAWYLMPVNTTRKMPVFLVGIRFLIRPSGCVFVATNYFFNLKWKNMSFYSIVLLPWWWTLFYTQKWEKIQKITFFMCPHLIWMWEIKIEFFVPKKLILNLDSFKQNR